MMRSLTLAAWALALAAPAAVAQGACDDLGRFYATPPKIGEWADMRVDMKKDGGKKPVTMRVGFVGREEHQGKQMYRMQMIMSGKDGKPHVMQTLTPWGAEAVGREYDTELVMKMGDQPAMIMPVKANEMQKWDIRKECAKISYTGDETVSVPAGSFKTRHYKGPDSESWMSPDVPGWRLVKMVTAKGDQIVLTGTGKGFENRITEKPMNMQDMMRNPEAVKKMMEAQRQ